MEISTKEVKSCKDMSVFFIGDVHQGNANHDNEAFRKAVRHIKDRSQEKDRTVSVITLGDMADCINAKDPRFSPSEIDENYTLKDLKDLPQKQLDKVCSDLAPIRDYIDAAVVGNHEEAFIKHNGVDLYNYFCNKLECKKLGFSGFMKYKLEMHGKKKTILVALTHGTGGGGYREGYPLNTCMDIFRKYDADVHIMGHLHKMMEQNYNFATVGNNDRKKEVKKWYGTNGCFLSTLEEGTRNYFEGQKGMLSDIGFLELDIKYTGDTWDYKLVKHFLR